MKITREEIAHITRLIKLGLDENEFELVADQLNRLLEYIERLDEIDTSEVEPTFHVIPRSNVFREDTVRPSLSREESLANAPERTENFLLSPKSCEYV